MKWVMVGGEIIFDLGLFIRKKENKRSGARVESGCTAGKHCNHRDEKCLSSKRSPESRVVLNL